MSGGLEQIIVGIADAVPVFRSLLEIGAILLGLVYFAEAGGDFIKISKGRQGNGNGGFQAMEPLAKFACGALLISFGLTVETMVNTISGSFVAYDVLNEQKVTGHDQYNMMLTAILHIIQVVGLVGIFTGITIFKAASSGQQHASIGKAFTHILGGAVAVNLLGAVKMFEETTKLNLGSYLGS